MKTVITRLIIAAVLALGAWLSWSEAKAHRLVSPTPESGSRPSICGSTMTSDRPDSQRHIGRVLAGRVTAT